LITWAEAKLGALVDVTTAAFAEVNSVAIVARKLPPQLRTVFRLKNLITVIPVKSVTIHCTLGESVQALASEFEKAQKMKTIGFCLYPESGSAD
jgi:hypothetical protein